MGVVNIYTDGSCKGNPGPGGWAAILEFNGHEKIIKGGEAHTTNNKMELSAVVNALTTLTRPCTVRVVTDSKYVADSFTKGWYENWIIKNDRGRPNFELWEILHAYSKTHHITMEWVRGHQGHEYNERCDTLAQLEAEKFLRF